MTRYYRITRDGLSALAYGEDLGETELRVLMSLLDRPGGHAYKTILNKVHPPRYKAYRQWDVDEELSRSIRLLSELGYITSGPSTPAERLELEYVLGLPEVRELSPGITSVGGTTIGSTSDFLSLEEYDAASGGKIRDRGTSRN